MSLQAAAFSAEQKMRCSVWNRLLRNPLTASGICLLTLLLGLTLIGLWLSPHDPVTVQMTKRLQPPSWEYPLGTDHFGRCLMARLAAGAKTTLSMASLALACIILIGVPVGMIAGYAGGRVDAVVMRMVDGAGALPSFLVAVATTGFLGPSLPLLILSVVLVKWTGYARVVRTIVLSEREKEYILAARVAGCGTWTILCRHLLPQAVPSVLVLAAFDVGKIILTISSLSYLGLGAQPPTPEWGAMLNDGRPYFQTVPALMVYPGLAIFLTVAASHLIAEGLRDMMDVRAQ